MYVSELVVQREPSVCCAKQRMCFNLAPVMYERTGTFDSSPTKKVPLSYLGVFSTTTTRSTTLITVCNITKRTHRTLKNYN